MHVIDWVVVGLYLAGTFTTVSMVGKPRKSTTPGSAALVVAIHLTLIVALLWSHGVIA